MQEFRGSVHGPMLGVHLAELCASAAPFEHGCDYGYRWADTRPIAQTLEPNFGPQDCQGCPEHLGQFFKRSFA